MTQKSDGKMLEGVRREVEQLVRSATEAYGEELQARRPETIDEEGAEAAKMRADLQASIALRVAAATSDPELLAFARERIGLFVPMKAIDAWIRQGQGEGHPHG